MRLRLVLRLFLALVLLVTAVGKLLDIPGFAGVLATYEAFPEPALLPIAVSVALTELALALWLFSGLRIAAAAAAALGLHTLYTAVAVATLLRGLRPANCGCFGVFLPRPLGWRTVVEDLVLAGVSVGLLVLSRRKT